MQSPGAPGNNGLRGRVYFPALPRPGGSMPAAAGHFVWLRRRAHTFGRGPYVIFRPAIL